MRSRLHLASALEPANVDSSKRGFHPALAYRSGYDGSHDTLHVVQLEFRWPDPEKMPACEACRISDTACDLGRPKCSSCTTRSLACVYPPSRDGYTFVDQNAVAAHASRRAANRRSRAPTASFPLSIREENPIVAGPATGLPAPVLYSLDDRAIRRFFSRWAVGETCVNCIEFMPRLHEASGEDSPIRCAVLATAYADLAVSDRHGDHRSQSYGTYLKTLRRLQTQLLDPNFIPSDNIFAAILAVDAFEVRKLLKHCSRISTDPRLAVVHGPSSAGRNSRTGNRSDLGAS